MQSRKIDDGDGLAASRLEPLGVDDAVGDDGAPGHLHGAWRSSRPRQVRRRGHGLFGRVSRTTGATRRRGIELGFRRWGRGEAFLALQGHCRGAGVGHLAVALRDGGHAMATACSGGRRWPSWAWAGTVALGFKCTVSLLFYSFLELN